MFTYQHKSWCNNRKI